MPQWKLYWSTEPDFALNIIKQTLPRVRFEKIKHLANNDQLDNNDKFSKIRSFIDIANKKFMQFGIFSHNLSIDEQMIPYFGQHSCKMFIRGKPVRFGFKAWCLCSANGYLFQSNLYGGASKPHDKIIGLGADVVMSLLENVDAPSSHRSFFDYFFTSYHLMYLLKERRFFATGKYLFFIIVFRKIFNFILNSGRYCTLKQNWRCVFTRTYEQR